MKNEYIKDELELARTVVKNYIKDLCNLAAREGYSSESHVSMKISPTQFAEKFGDIKKIADMIEHLSKE